jgi:hypothetical protein
VPRVEGQQEGAGGEGRAGSGEFRRFDRGLFHHCRLTRKSSLSRDPGMPIGPHRARINRASSQLCPGVVGLPSYSGPCGGGRGFGAWAQLGSSVALECGPRVPRPLVEKEKPRREAFSRGVAPNVIGLSGPDELSFRMVVPNGRSEWSFRIVAPNRRSESSTSRDRARDRSIAGNRWRRPGWPRSLIKGRFPYLTGGPS